MRTQTRLRTGTIKHRNLAQLGLLLLCLSSMPCVAGQLAIIVDDLGYNAALGHRATLLPGSFTLAILPFTPHGHELAEAAHRQGKELILHAPMSNTQALPIEQGGLLSDMNAKDFHLALEKMLQDVPYIRGLNNHMGSQLTQESTPMNWLMEALVERSLYFVDSRTTAASLALDIAQQHHLPSAKRDIFLDNQRSQQLILKQLHKVLKLAKAQGKAIAIGHPYPETLAVLEEIQPLLADYGVQLVAVSQLVAPAVVHYTAASNSSLDYCPAPPLLLRRAGSTDNYKGAIPWLDWISFSYESR